MPTVLLCMYVCSGDAGICSEHHRKRHGASLSIPGHEAPGPLQRLVVSSARISWHTEVGVWSLGTSEHLESFLGLWGGGTPRPSPSMAMSTAAFLRNASTCVSICDLPSNGLAIAQLAAALSVVDGREQLRLRREAKR
jgi:hypothetical protein